MTGPAAIGDGAALRQLVREVLREMLPAIAGAQAGAAGPAGPAGPAVPGQLREVRLTSDAELRAFVLNILRLADDPRQRQDILTGRVRFTLARPAGTQASEAAAHRIDKGAVTERAVTAAARAGARLVLGRGAVLTPLARDRARALGVPIEKER